MGANDLPYLGPDEAESARGADDDGRREHAGRRYGATFRSRGPGTRSSASSGGAWTPSRRQHAPSSSTSWCSPTSNAPTGSGSSGATR